VESTPAPSVSCLICSTTSPWVGSTTIVFTVPRHVLLQDLTPFSRLCKGLPAAAAREEENARLREDKDNPKKQSL
jgi:hypothetical protein